MKLILQIETHELFTNPLKLLYIFILLKTINFFLHDFGELCYVVINTQICHAQQQKIPRFFSCFSFPLRIHRTSKIKKRRSRQPPLAYAITKRLLLKTFHLSKWIKLESPNGHYIRLPTQSWKQVFFVSNPREFRVPPRIPSLRRQLVAQLGSCCLPFPLFFFDPSNTSDIFKLGPTRRKARSQPARRRSNHHANKLPREQMKIIIKTIKIFFPSIF